MARFNNSELRKIVEWFSQEPGYVLDFSNTTFAELFDDEFGIDIYDHVFERRGNSKVNRLKMFLESASPTDAAKLLRVLW